MYTMQMEIYKSQNLTKQSMALFVPCAINFANFIILVKIAAVFPRQAGSTSVYP